MISAEQLATLGAAFVLGIAIPWGLMRILVPSLTSPGATTTNYRGARVSLGLGVVWLVWGICALLAGFTATLELRSSSLGILMMAGLLAVLAFGFGLVDDAYGSGDARGFKGHLSALLHGRLTTGGMKLVGIGVASLAAAVYMGAAGLVLWAQGPARFWTPLVAGAAIALTANLLNLTDLRPGRALKAYILLGAAGWALATFVWVPFFMKGAAVEPLDRIVDAAGLALLLAGPVVAVWRYDLREIGMLGDSGANPMGAVAGFLIVCGLSLWGLIAYAIAVLALNLASERVSFSRVIESTPPLRWFDGLGRHADAPPPHSAELTAHDGNKPE